MKKRPARWAVAALAVQLSCYASGVAQSRGDASVLAAFERVARELVVFGPGQFIHGFLPDSYLPRTDQALGREFAEFLGQGSRTADDFRPLLRHPDPKVRTLALVALYDLEDPKVLSDIFPLVNDGASTFRAAVPVARMWDPRGALTIPTKEQTVGAIATEILNVYLQSGGYSYGPSGLRGQPGFDAYWKAHARRSSSAGWWSVRLARASYATSPTPVERFDKVRALRSRIGT